MNILNIGIGVVTRKLDIKIYSLAKPKGINAGKVVFEDDIVYKIKNPSLDVSKFKPFDNNALVNEEPCYIDLMKLADEDEFYFIRKALAQDNIIGNAVGQVGLTKKDFQNIDKRKENIRFLILEEKDRYLLLYLSPYKNVIKNKHGFTVGNKPTKFDIDYGIIYPEYVTAILDKKSWRLSIADVSNFERMFNLKNVRFAQAKSVLDKFKNQSYKLGKDGIIIKLSDKVDLNLKEYQKTRQITYISCYDPNNANYSTESIREAMKHIPQEERLKIDISDNSNKKVIEINNAKQFKTFSAVLHDSILHRMLSDKYEVM